MRDSAIIPRWPSAAILDIIKRQIAPFDSPTPKTLAYNQPWSGSDTVCEIFAFKLYCDLETWVRGHSRSLKAAPLDRPIPKTWPQKQTWRPLAQRLRSCGHFCMSKMAVSHHLGFYRTANSAIRSTDPENPSLGPNMEWIECTVWEIFAFKVHCDLETGVRGHSRSSKVALFDRAHTTLYSSSTVTMPLSNTLFKI